MNDFNDDDESMKEFSLEVDENELLRELEALSTTGSGSKTANCTVNNHSNLVNKYDYNEEEIIDNVFLTPEDENNPELLAELSSILSSTPSNTHSYKPSNTPSNTHSINSSVSSTPKNSTTDILTDLKKEILRLKREGDIEGAKMKLLQLKQLESLDNNKNHTNNSSNSSNINSPKEKISSSSKDNVSISPKNKIPLSPVTSSPKSSDVHVYRDLFAKLQKQTALCQTISDFYTSANRKNEGTLFVKRKQAIDLEIQKLRLMLKNKQPAPQYKTVNISYENVLINPDVPEGKLQVTIGHLQVVHPRKFKLKDNEEYTMKVTYEINGLTEQEMTLTSEPFTTSGLMNNNLKTFTFKCNKKDMKVLKSIEYKKIKIEIFVETGFLFFKSLVLRSTSQFKLDRLLKDCSIKEEIELFDVGEDGKKSSLASSKLSFLAKLNTPLTSNGFKQCKEKWVVIPEFGFSNHTLYDDLMPAPSQSNFILPANSPKTNTLADHIKSFEVIEYELALLSQNQALVLNDPNLMDLQVSLESLRDRIQMQVELGQISLDDYLISVKESINETKTRALQSKRSGDLQMAQKYVKHVEIMKKEIYEAELSVSND